MKKDTNFKSHANYYGHANYKCPGVFKSMFCHNKDGVAYMMFNKQLTPEKYDEISGKMNIPFKKVAWTNHAEVMEALEKDQETCHGEKLEKINNYETRKEAWRPVLKELLTLRDLDIWDEGSNDVVEVITGWNLDEEARGTIEELTIE